MTQAQESLRNSYGALLEAGAPLNCKPFGSGGPHVTTTVAGFLSHKALQAVNRRLVPMSQHIIVARAREARERLLAVAEACTELGVPLPERAKLAEAIGCTPRQMARHLAALIDQGVVERRTWKWRMAA